MKTRLSPVLKFSHWVVAGSVFFLLASSWWMLALPLPSADFTYRVLPFQLHKNVGMTVLALVVFMMAKKTFDSKSNLLDPPSEESKKIERLRLLGHYFLYILLITCCVSGYLSSSYSGWGTDVWWLFSLPAWAEENDELNSFYSDIHLWICWLLVLVVMAHVCAALHHALKNDGAIDSMFESESD